MNDFFQQPFVQGLILGLIFAGVVFLYGWKRQRFFKIELMMEREKAKTSLSDTTFALIEANRNIKVKNEDLEEKISNLKATVAKLIEKPNNADKVGIFLYETARKSLKEELPEVERIFDRYLTAANGKLKHVKNGKLPLVCTKVLQMFSVPAKTINLSVEPDPPSS